MDISHVPGSAVFVFSPLRGPGRGGGRGKGGWTDHRIGGAEKKICKIYCYFTFKFFLSCLLEKVTCNIPISKGNNEKKNHSTKRNSVTRFIISGFFNQTTSPDFKIFFQIFMELHICVCN